jgi:deazaflavin-dependent oxidoreductase (nitroreductase family)
MADMNDFNQQIIDEFRANGGVMGGQFAGTTLLLLHTTGARSGTERVNPVAYQQVGDDMAVFASKAGAPTNPDWYHNLKANPRATVEVGTETYPVTVREAQGQERTRIWEVQKAAAPGFADYEKATSRTIPVMILSRAG